MRVLAITKIFPNSLEPLSSPFNRQQFIALSKKCELTVLEAIPYFPASELTGQPPRAAKLAALPAHEMVDGVDTFYMRQLYLPRVGLSVAMPLYLASLLPFRGLARRYDVILATWAYPDGCASVLFANALGKPSVVKVHGSDVNVVAKTAVARGVMRAVLPRADAMVTVSRALGHELEQVGVPGEKIHLVANGVDTQLFAPRDRDTARRELGVPKGRPLIVFVGRLEPQKGLGDLLEAFAMVRKKRPDAILALIGDGVLAGEVRAKRDAWGDALLAPGARPLAEVARWMTACDVFTLPSWNEGTPNVVLEALASGRPAVGSRVGGIPDVLADPRSGLLVPAKDPRALADALMVAIAKRWDAADVRACGPSSWTESAAHLYDVLQRVVTSRARNRSA
jgi:teichuronic acid biosynthesis glycosyltransferase TuaC